MSDFTDPKNPGSFVARRHGCTCDQIKNGYGRGAFVSGGGETQWLIAPTCPIHGKQAA